MSDNSTQEIVRFLQRQNIQLKQENQELQREVHSLRDVLEALQGLQEVSAGLNMRTDVLFLMNRILESALTSILATDGSLMLLDEETGELVFVVVYGQVGQSLLGYRIAPSEGIAGWVAKNKQPVIVEDVNRDPRFSPEVDQEFKFHTHSMVSVPILFGDDVLGVIQALNKKDGALFTEADQTLLSVVAQLAATAMTTMTRLMGKA